MNASLWYVAYALLAVFVVSNVAALALGTPNPTRTRRALPWLQRSTSLQLALLAWVFSLAGRDTALAPWTLGIAIGMSVSFVADLIMAQMIRLPNHVLGGMVVFALAHTAYLWAYVQLGQRLGLLRAPAVILSLVVFWALGLVLWRRLVYTPTAPAALTYGALGYMLFLAAMTAVAVALTLAEPRLWTLGPGAVLFLVSDAILGNQLFRKHEWPYVSEAVWLTYIIGQAGIVWANGLALPLLG